MSSNSPREPEGTMADVVGTEGAERGGETISPAASTPVVNATTTPARPRNRIQVSREKRPLNFFVGLAKKFLTNEDEVELSGLGLAVTTVVTVVEILRTSGHVEISRISTSLVDTAGEGRGGVPKAKIQIWIRKGEKFPCPAENGGPSTVTTPPMNREPSPTPASLATVDDIARESLPPVTEPSQAGATDEPPRS